MAGNRKLWATRFGFVAAQLHRHESHAATYRYIQRQAELWADGILRSQHLTVFVDERDGRGFQTYERIDLAELAAGEG